ncbi:hypothetical protein [Streptomyces clavifer]|uniref:hypothetical protein n=1 Tax=Streptomyces clavifer TaxID=68188 RepID=UPI0033D96CBC
MITRIDRRAGKRVAHRVGRAFCATALAASVALAVPAVAGARTVDAAPVAKAAVSSSTPVGRWQGTVEHANGSGNITLSFHSSGLVCLGSGDSATGGGQGMGVWWPTGTNTFSYRVLEVLREAEGPVTGFVDVNQKATQNVANVSSSGVSKIYDAQGTYLLSANATVTVKRVATAPGSC